MRAQNEVVSIQSLMRNESDDSQFKTRIVEPNGLAATQVSVLSVDAKKFTQMGIGDAFKNPATQVFEIPHEGALTLDLSSKMQFVFLYSDQGCAFLAAPRILSTDHVALIPWSMARIKVLRQGEPVPDMKVQIDALKTSDFMFRTPLISFFATTNQHGIATFDRIPVSDVIVRINPTTVGFGNQSWLEDDQHRFMRTIAGESLDVTFGENVRDVVGQFRYDEKFNDGKQAIWGAEIEVVGENRSVVPLTIDEEGSFIAQGVPLGEVAIMVRHPGLPNIGGPLPANVGPFAIEKASDGTNKTQDLGELILDFASGQRARTKKRKIRLDEPLQMVQDNFSTTETVSFVGMTRKGDDFDGALFDQNGKLLRRIDGIPKANGEIAAIDRKRQRVYIICEINTSYDDQELRAYDLNGKLVYKRPLDQGVHHIAIDDENGAIWLQRNEPDGGDAVCLHADGTYDQTIETISANSICYAAVDRSFWLVGRDEITNIDASSKRKKFVRNLPVRMVNNRIRPLQNGSALILQSSDHSTLTASRVWKIDSNAMPLGVFDFGSYGFVACLEFKSQVLLAANRADRSLSQIKYEVALFASDRDLQRFTDTDYIQDLDSASQLGLGEESGFWCFDSNGLKRIEPTTESFRTVHSKENTEGIVTILAQ